MSHWIRSSAKFWFVCGPPYVLSCFTILLRDFSILFVRYLVHSCIYTEALACYIRKALGV